jgi:hypothetical protein
MLQLRIEPAHFFKLLGLLYICELGVCHMEQRGFGRRGLTLDGSANAAPPPSFEPPRSAPARPAHINSDGSFNGWRWVVVMVICVVIVLAWVEALFSGTALITPLDATVLWTMRGIGAVMGLVVGVMLFTKIRQENSTAKAALTVLVMPILFAFMFDGIAWRAADWATFGLSSQAYEEAQYPIESITPGRKGRRDTINIDPFSTGEPAGIPVSDAQYNELQETSVSSCVTVMQRKAPSGAIEILTDGDYTLREPAPVEITPCVI